MQCTDQRSTAFAGKPTLLLWAANARKRAANEPKQRDLFSANSGEA